jgi:hypothetical protein
MIDLSRTLLRSPTGMASTERRSGDCVSAKDDIAGQPHHHNGEEY